MASTIERIRAQKMESYYRTQQRKKEKLEKDIATEFLEKFPNWEQDKFRIPEKYRAVLEGYYALGTAKLSLQQIGEELGISKQAVQEFRDKGLKRLAILSDSK
jgi:DNA-directed RNA polymerase specialized sigma subunit